MTTALHPVRAEPITFEHASTLLASINTPSMSLDQVGIGDWDDHPAARAREIVAVVSAERTYLRKHAAATWAAKSELRPDRRGRRCRRNPYNVSNRLEKQANRYDCAGATQIGSQTDGN